MRAAKPGPGKFKRRRLVNRESTESDESWLLYTFRSPRGRWREGHKLSVNREYLVEPERFGPQFS